MLPKTVGEIVSDMMSIPLSVKDVQRWHVCRSRCCFGSHGIQFISCWENAWDLQTNKGKMHIWILVIEANKCITSCCLEKGLLYNSRMEMQNEKRIAIATLKFNLKRSSTQNFLEWAHSVDDSPVTTLSVMTPQMSWRFHQRGYILDKITLAFLPLT